MPAKADIQPFTRQPRASRKRKRWVPAGVYHRAGLRPDPVAGTTHRNGSNRGCGFRIRSHRVRAPEWHHGRDSGQLENALTQNL